MLGINKILVADKSSVMQHMMKLSLRGLACETFSSGNLHQAVHILDDNPDINLVITDVSLDSEADDYAGFSLIEHANKYSNRTIKSMVLSTQSDDALRDRAARLGAVSFHLKPVLPCSIIRAWMDETNTSSKVPRSDRKSLETCVFVIDSKDRSRHLISWKLRDVSLTGAFIETRCPVDPGTTFDIAISLDDQHIYSTVEVIRVQSPSWESPGGIGVKFIEMDSYSKNVLGSKIN